MGNPVHRYTPVNQQVKAQCAVKSGPRCEPGHKLFSLVIPLSIDREYADSVSSSSRISFSQWLIQVK